MTRLIIAVAAVSLFAGAASAQDYPPCRSPGQDHCRVEGHMGYHHWAEGRHHHVMHHRHVARHHHATTGDHR
jgi:hypothetical protein